MHNVSRTTLFPVAIPDASHPFPSRTRKVKPSKADDTAAVRQWESRTLPGYKRKPAGSHDLAGFFIFIFGSGLLSLRSLVEMISAAS